MNILILGTDKSDLNIINLCLKSKHLDHIYTASAKPLDKIPNIEYSDFQDLCQKAKALKIDLILLSNKEFIKNGFIEFCKKNLLNIISVNSKWFNLESSRLAAKQLLNYYSINNPEIIKAPLFFPVVIKSNTPYLTKIAYSMNELVSYREELGKKNAFLEEFLNGDIYYLLSIWDGKNLLSFYNPEIFTEVQLERLDLYKTKLNFMLSDEKADFTGFFTTKLIWAKNDWYVLEYKMSLDEKSDLDLIKSDFLYLLNSAIYQKLN